MSKAATSHVIICFISMVVFSACARTIRFDVSSVVPAAEGKVKVKKEQNGNYAMNIRVNNLANPEDLPVKKATYVVWSESSDGIKNLGQLDVKNPIFTNSLQAALRTVSTFQPKRIFVTAEDSATPGYPANQVVLTTPTFN